MQRTTTFKRMMSAFLAIILLLGLTPSIPLPAFAAENGMPDTISYIKTEFGINGDVGLTAESNGAKYHSSHLGGTVYVQDFQMKADGETVHGFCFDHTKHLDNKEPYVSDTWTYSKKIEKDDIANYPFLPFLDYYYWELENGTDQFTLAVHRMYAQSAIWLTVNNKQFVSPYDDASLQLLIDERNAYFASLDDSQVPPDTGYGALNMFHDIVKIWEGKTDKEVPHRNYYLYYPSNSTTQPVLIPELVPTEEPREAYIRLVKQDGEGTALGGCTFTIYSDSSCSPDTEAGTFESGSDGNGVGKVTWQGSETTKTFWVKETATKPGYVLVSGAHPVTVDSEVNNSPETAAVVEGSPFLNEKIPDEPVLMKVNQDGAGIGPAIFHFEGNGELSGYIADDFPVDESGLLDLQWWDPQGDNYIEPGEYTVTEKEAPPGCEPSTEAQHIKLWLDDANQPHSSGTLTFINNQEPFLKIEKRDMDNQPLAGAKFEIRKDGEVVGYGVTDETGSFTFEGTDGNGLERGFYVIEEIEPPAGYLLPADPIKAIYIDPGKMTETIVIPFTNYDYPDIVIQKLDKNSRIPLAGATFEIMFDAEHTMEVGPTGPDGRVIITYEEYGKFLQDTGKESWTIQVRETGAPEGYFLTDTSWHTLELHRGQTLKPFIFEDYKYPEIVIRKSDRETEERLEGTTFEISIDAGASFSLTKQTDANGEIWITYDDYEKYLGEISWDRGWTVTVTETITTDKYNKDKQEESGDWTITKQLLPGQSLLEFDFTDTHYRDLLIRKYDSTNSW